MEMRNLLSMLAVVFASIMLFAGSTAKMSAQLICGSGNSGPLGNDNQYVFMGDQWNGSFTFVDQCVQVTNSTTPPPASLSGTGAGPSTKYISGTFDDTTGTPADYPDILYGLFHGSSTSNTQLPMAVTKITGSNPAFKVLSGENVVEPSGFNNDMAYDIWFNTFAGTPSNQNTTGTELMIWVQHNGGAGTISGGPTYSFTDPTTGQNWTAFTGTNTGNCGCSGAGSQVISFVRNNSDGPTPAGGLTEKLNLDDFFTEALNVGQIQSSWFLTAVEFGTEIWVGGPGLEVNNFWVNIVPSSGGGGTSGGGGATLTTGTPFNIVNENSGSCIDDTGDGTANGTKVEQRACADGSDSTATNQEWEFKTGTASGFYEVTNVNAPTEAWNVTGNGTTNGSLIQTWTYAGAPNEEWEAVSLGNGFYKFVGQGSGLCLDTPGASTANGVQLQIFTCNGTAAQAFKLVTP